MPSTHAILFSTVAATVLAAGCVSVLGIDDDYVLEIGAGGSGGEATSAQGGSSSGGGATSSTGGAGGAGGAGMGGAGMGGATGGNGGAGGGSSSMPLGAACSSDPQCQSGFCIDGVCCGSACAGSCFACAAAKTGSADGSCAPVSAGQDPDSECGATAACDGLGNCKLKNGISCGGGVSCVTGNCTDGVCCDKPCNGVCEACSMALSGLSDGSCAFIATGTDPENECPGNDKCNGAGVCL